MVEKVIATDAALQLIDKLKLQYPSMLFHQSGGCCDNSAANCYLPGEITIGAGDVYLGEIGGFPRRGRIGVGVSCASGEREDQDGGSGAGGQLGGTSGGGGGRSDAAAKGQARQAAAGVQNQPGLYPDPWSILQMIFS